MSSPLLHLRIAERVETQQILAIYLVHPDRRNIAREQMQRFTQRSSRRTKDQGYALCGRLMSQAFEKSSPQRRFKGAVEEGSAQLIMRIDVNFPILALPPTWGLPAEL